MKKLGIQPPNFFGESPTFSKSWGPGNFSTFEKFPNPDFFQKVGVPEIFQFLKNSGTTTFLKKLGSQKFSGIRKFPKPQLF
jgi:hypothetical protein